MSRDVSRSLPRTSAALVSTGARAPAWAAVLAAMAIDLADFAMIGPIGVAAGLFVGFTLTSVLALATGAPVTRALLLGLLGGVYCMLPITDVVPLATMLTTLHVALLRRREPPAIEPSQPTG